MAQCCKRERSEKFLWIIDLQDWPRQAGSEKTQIGRRGQARLRDQLQLRQLPDDALDIFAAIF